MPMENFKVRPDMNFINKCNDNIQNLKTSIDGWIICGEGINRELALFPNGGYKLVDGKVQWVSL